MYGEHYNAFPEVTKKCIFLCLLKHMFTHKNTWMHIFNFLNWHIYNF